MAEQGKDVLFRLRVDSGQGSQSVDRLAQSARTADKAFQDAERSAARMNQAAGGGPGIGRFVGVGQANQADPARGFGVPGFGALFGLGVVARSVEAVGTAFQTVSRSTGTFSQAMGELVTTFATGLPIIGSFFRGINSVIDAFSDIPGQRLGAQEFLGLQSGRLGLQGAIGGARLGGAAQLGGLGRLTGNAAIDAAAAGQIAGFAGNVAFNNPRAVFGVTTGAEGDLAFGVAQARVQAEAANRQAALEAGRFDAFRRSSGVDFLSGRVRDLRGEAQGLGLRRNAAEQAVAESFGGGIFRNRTLEGNAIQALQNEQAKLNQLKQTEKTLEEALGRVGAERQKLSEAQRNAAQANLAVAKAELEVERNRLGIANQRLEGGRGLAGFLGRAQPGEAEALRHVLEEAQRNPNALLNEGVRGLIGQAGPAGAAFLQERDLARGRNDPLFQQLQGLLGLGGGGLGGLEQDQARLQQSIREAAAKAEKTFRDAIGAEANTFASDMAQIIRETLRSVIERLRAEFQVERNQQNPILAGRQRE